MSAILGYARVSTSDQDVAGQTMRLTEAGVIKVFGDVRSGRTMERPGLEALLAYAREGDTLAVVRLDRLGRSLGELLTAVAMPQGARHRPAQPGESRSVTDRGRKTARARTIDRLPRGQSGRY